MSVYKVMRYCRNFFTDGNARHGEWIIRGGSIDLSSFIKDNQYFLVEESSFNDGVYKYPATGQLNDETFTGYITPLAPPTEFLELCEKIDEWEKKNLSNDSSNLSPFQSESFGGYSYSKGSNGSTGAATAWSVFANELNLWRKY